MSRKKSYKIYDLDYLLKGDFTEDDLYYLFDTSSLTYSLIVNMFIFSRQSLVDEKKIIKLIKSDNEWMYKYFWTDKQIDQYENIIKDIYKKIKYYNDKEALEYAQWWISLYGLTNSKLKNVKNIPKLSE